MKPSIAVVVDDSAYDIRMIDLALRKWRFNVISTSLAVDLAGLVAAYRPSLVVLDAEMPGVDGPSLVRFIRKDPGLRGATVLLHAALDGESLARRVAECDADGYVLRSRDPAVLEQQLRAWLPR